MKFQVFHKLLHFKKLSKNGKTTKRTWAQQLTFKCIFYFAKMSLVASHLSIKWLHGHKMYAFSPVGPTHSASKTFAHETHLSSCFKQGVPCWNNLVTMTIWVNSPHRDGRLGVTWLLEFLFTPIMPFATIMFRVSNVENPTFSVELEWGRTITSIHLLFSTLYLHYTCKSLIHILNIKFKLIGTNTE
jgi:hypothetical protein